MQFFFETATTHPARWLLLLTQLAIIILALVLADLCFDGLRLDDAATTVAAAALLALAHSYLRPLLMWMTLPLNILTFGLFTLLINGLLLALVSWLLPGLHLDGFWTAIASALLISMVSLALNLLLRPNRIRVEIR